MMFFFGSLLLLFGVLLFIAQVFALSVWLLFRTWWPLALAAYGLYRLGTRRGSPFWNILLSLCGVVLILQPLLIFQGSFWRFLLSVLFCVAGAWIILRALRPAPSNDASSFAFSSTSTGQRSEATFSAGKVQQIHADTLQESLWFTAATHVYESGTFSGGQIEAHSSSLVLDLRHVVPLEPVLEIQVRASFSTILLLCPMDWEVRKNGQVLQALSGTVPACTVQITTPTFLFSKLLLR